jgi:putative membrane protein
MKRMWLAAATLALTAACNPDGAGDHQTGAVDREYQVRAGGRTDTAMTPGTSGIGTTGATSGGSGDTRAAAITEGGALDDAGILSRIASSNRKEVQEAQLAQRQARSVGVRELAQALERDHSASLVKVQALLAEATGQAGAGNRKEALESSPKEDAGLAGMAGAEFEKAFLDRQHRLHEEDIRNFENQYLAAAQDAELRTLIQQTLPTLRQHLSMIERLQDQR